MTQTITLAADHGIWQSSDMRTSIGNTTKDDFSLKHVVVNCPDGVAVLSYAGAGSILVTGKYVDISEWIRQILRGQGRGLDETFIYLRERANEDLGRLLFKEGIPHMFTVASFLRGVPWVLQIRNFPTWPLSAAASVEPVFRTVVMKVAPGQRIVTQWPALRPSEHRRIMRLSSKPPRHWKQISDLLASVNLQVANRERSVSPHCVVTYVPNREDLNGVHTELYNCNRDLFPSSPAFIYRGIDLTQLSGGHRDAAELEEAARNSVIPSNPLRPETDRKS